MTLKDEPPVPSHPLGWKLSKMLLGKNGEQLLTAPERSGRAKEETVLTCGSAW